MSAKKFLPLTDYKKLPEAEMKNRAHDFYKEMKRRRTVRQFSNEPVDRKIIDHCLRSAATAPSGANQQPWRFVVVSDPGVKRQIREASEKIEKAFYIKEATKTWRHALKDLKTGPQKPFLETAPYLIVIFSELYHHDANNKKIKHYYVTESVGISTGILIAALHHAGLAALTYTPANMRFLNNILSRPSNEKPFMILVAGYPASDASVPALKKKSLADFCIFT